MEAFKRLCTKKHSPSAPLDPPPKQETKGRNNNYFGRRGVISIVEGWEKEGGGKVGENLSDNSTKKNQRGGGFEQ